MNLTKYHIFWRRSGLYCAAQSLWKRLFKSGSFAVKPLSDLVIFPHLYEFNWTKCFIFKSYSQGRFLTCAAGLGIFLGTAPSFEGGEVIMNPVEEAPKTFPGLNGLIAPLAPLTRPGGSWRINLPLKKGVPLKGKNIQRAKRTERE